MGKGGRGATNKMGGGGAASQVLLILKARLHCPTVKMS